MRFNKSFFSTFIVISLSILKSILAVDLADPFCETACTSCCNVKNDTMFTQVVALLTYPDVSFTGLYTVLTPGIHYIGATVYQGTVYQEVVRYANDRNDHFTQNVRIFSSDPEATLICNNSTFYFDGTAFPLEFVNDTSPYCKIGDINGILNRSKLEDYTLTSGIYFAFNQLVEERTDYRIMFDYGNDIVPRDDTLDYQFALNVTSLTNVDTSTEHYIRMEVRVNDLNELIPDPSCDTLDELMTVPNAKVYIDINSRCPLEYMSSSGDETTTTGKTFVYKIPQASYELCAESFTNDGTNIVFTSKLYLPTFESLEDTCFYFQPGSSIQAISITMNAQISDGITTTFERFSADLIDVDIVRCPAEDYPIPQAYVEFTINATFQGNGTSGLSWYIIRDAYLSYPGSLSEKNILYGGGVTSGPGIGNEEFFSDCVVLTTVDGTFNRCTFRFKTGQCEKIYVTDSGSCGFERNTTRYIRDLSFREEYNGGLYIEHRTAPINTYLDNMVFPSAKCSQRADAPIVNVNDEFPTRVLVRNYYDSVDVNWLNTSGYPLTFTDKITLRLSVGEASSMVLNDLSLNIQSVMVSLRDPSANDLLLAQYVFNVVEKSKYMKSAWSVFRTDPIFCSWYEPGSGPNGDKCQKFNAYSRQAFIPSQSVADHSCVIPYADSLSNANVRNVDYWTFDPSKWFTDLYSRPFLKVVFTISAAIRTCGVSGDAKDNDRRLLKDHHKQKHKLAKLPHRELQTTTFRYVSDELIVIFGTNADGSDDTTVLRPDTGSKVTDNMPLIIGASVSGGVFILVVLLFVCHRSRSEDSSLNYATVNSAALF